MRARRTSSFIPVAVAVVFAALLYTAAVAFGGGRPQDAGPPQQRETKPVPAVPPSLPDGAPQTPAAPEDRSERPGRPDDPGAQGGVGGGAPGEHVPPGHEHLPAGVEPPALGRTAVVAPGNGVVRVRRPGGTGFVPLAAGASVPTGTVVDATAGSVQLSTALPDGSVQTGTFSGGRFLVRQDPAADGMTDVVLAGGSFRRCRQRRSGVAVAVASATPRRKVVRRLWGTDDGGRFRTRGHDSIATVRGTRWLTEDRCDGTLTRVVEGAVAVRSLRTGRVTLVTAGRSHLVRR